MKICHVTSVHSPEDGRIFRRACVSAKKAGYDTYLIQKGDTYEKLGVHIVGIGIPKKSSRMYRMTVFSNKAYQAALDVDADLYHIHDPELLPFARKLKKKGKKVVFDSHENYSDMILRKVNIPFNRLFGRIIYSYMEKTYKEIDGVTYPSDDEYYRRLEKICKRSCLSRNYPWKRELYDKYDEALEKEKNTACFIGTLSAGHGIVEIIKACYNAGFKLYLAGTFYSSEFKKKVFSMPEYSCVEYMGVINRDQVLQTLQKTEIGLCILHNVGQFYTMQTLSTKIYECLAMGMPVILNNSPYNQRITNEMGFGVCVDPMDIEGIKDTLIKLSKDQEYKKHLSDNGRKASRDCFCWDIEQIKLLSMYESILNSEY